MSLVELVIALGLLTSVALVCFGLMQVGRQMADSTGEMSQLQTNVRYAVDRFCDEVRWGTRIDSAGQHQVVVAFDMGSPYRSQGYQLQILLADDQLQSISTWDSQSETEVWSEAVEDVSFRYFDDDGEVISGADPGLVAGVEVELTVTIAGRQYVTQSVAWLRGRR